MFVPFDTMTLQHDSGNRHDFPRLARESGFSFNLYRGRVDWSKIGSTDVDKIVRERDLETLQDLLSCVMSCNLSSEYDLKILDPNFLKIFQLAQLSSDFLLYCRNYLDHCVIVMQEQLRVALQEIEHLRQLKIQNAEEISRLEKKLKTKSKRTKLPNSSPVPVFKCCQCEKIFVGEQYLIAHQQRRHSELSAKEGISKNENNEVKDLQKQIQELQDRLHATEIALKEKQGFHMVDVTSLQTMQLTESEKLLKSKLMHNLSTAQHHLIDKEAQLQSVLENPVTVKPLEPKVSAKVEILDEASSSEQAIQYYNQKYENTEAAFLTQIEMLNCEIKSLHEQLHEQQKTCEITIQRKLEELQCKHQSDLDKLRLSITSKSQGSGDHISAQSDVSCVKVIGDSSLPLCNQHIVQTKNKEPGPSGTHIVKSSAETVIPSQFTLRNTVGEFAKAGSLVLPNCETMSVTAHQETVHQEEYVSPSEQESSESSSQSSSKSPLNRASKTSEENSGEVRKSKTSESQDRPNHIKAMYGKVRNYSSSETGSSSYDSDSQSLSSEQQPCYSGLDMHHSRLQLTPEVFDGLKEDLLGLLNRRLRELGVDPEWKELPVASFNSNLATVKHHQNIAAKSHHSYFEVQEALIKEVDKQVAEHLKLQQPVRNSIGTNKKKQSLGSFSLFARIKSHVKNRLSHSGHLSQAVKHSHKLSSKKGDLEENVYSQEPSTSKSSNEYETLQEKPISVANLSESSTPTTGQERKSEGSLMLHPVLPPSNPSPSNLIHISSESMPEKLKSGATDIKVYSRSMYANLNRHDIEVESKNLATDVAERPLARLQTSTPIKSQLSSSSGAGERKPTFISSDIESISEVETDANDGENLSRGSTVLKKHTTMTTAELLANVAKFRQSSGQGTETHSIVKSNLKSSLSTGNIMKKKVVFQDEKDGFNTLELGPAHSSFESLTPQRSLSENSLSTYSSGPGGSDRPVPQPRSSMLPITNSPVSGAINYESDGDWDWDKDSFDNTLTSKETMTEAYANIGKMIISGTTTSQGPAIEKQATFGTSDVRVSHTVKDLEKKLQDNSEKPSFGIQLAGSPTSVMGVSGTGNVVSGELSLPAFRSHINKKNDDTLSDLLLDDLSSS